ncbi:hypothetical protein MAR_033911 [Mya arenaria]|uniref:Uncharacterized protein n=1 Tax=Mya arenaria TaxID=6604 RepID=A0ABY7GCX9_MYAAR|nr:hypothetical protein MAR_033911 [Mya arenaria]
MLLSVYFTVLVVSASVTVLVGAPGEADFIQIPPDRCLISLDDFYDKVVGNYYTSPLVITSGRIGQVDAKNLSQRANFLWSVLDDGRVDHRIDEDGEGFLDEEPDFSGTDWCKIDSLITECLGSRLKDWQWKMLLKHGI